MNIIIIASSSSRKETSGSKLTLSINRLQTLLTTFFIFILGNNNYVHYTFALQIKWFNESSLSLPDGKVFSTPGFPNNYPAQFGSNIFLSFALYVFQAPANQRVHLHFDEFKTHDVEPECLKDFLDVYVDLACWTDIFTTNQSIIDDKDVVPAVPPPFIKSRLGRFCKNSSPVNLVSVNNLLVLAFLSRDMITEVGFRGTYKFIPKLRTSNTIKTINQNRHRQLECDFVYSNRAVHERTATTTTEFIFNDDDGYLEPPLYPGQYLPNKNYTFCLRSQTRVYLKFLEIGLGENDCGFDRVLIYNVLETSSNKDNIQLLHTFCGDRTIDSHPLNGSFFSSGKELIVHFQTAAFTMSSNRFGFRAAYRLGRHDEFLPILSSNGKSEQQQHITHISGSHCDYQIEEGEDMVNKSKEFSFNLNFATSRVQHQCLFRFLPGRKIALIIHLNDINGCKGKETDLQILVPTGSMAVKTHTSSLHATMFQTKKLSLCSIKLSRFNEGRFEIQAIDSISTNHIQLLLIGKLEVRLKFKVYAWYTSLLDSLFPPDCFRKIEISDDPPLLNPLNISLTSSSNQKELLCKYIFNVNSRSSLILKTPNVGQINMAFELYAFDTSINPPTYLWSYSSSSNGMKTESLGAPIDAAPTFIHQGGGRHQQNHRQVTLIASSHSNGAKRPSTNLTFVQTKKLMECRKIKEHTITMVQLNSQMCRWNVMRKVAKNNTPIANQYNSSVGLFVLETFVNCEDEPQKKHLSFEIFSEHASPTRIYSETVQPCLSPSSNGHRLLLIRSGFTVNFINEQLINASAQYIPVKNFANCRTPNINNNDSSYIIHYFKFVPS